MILSSYFFATYIPFWARKTPYLRFVSNWIIRYYINNITKLASSYWYITLWKICSLYSTITHVIL
nr:MAG TPA: hypothetical protein [Caudoviricetes sp.]DAV60154.1 MAG TPA: hypothetical protein [Caudoviricetes sp.]